MARARRPRLSWFRFYVDDFLGGTGALTAPECGRYLLLLLAQWGTKDEQSIPADPERLRVICRGEDPGSSVLSKFTVNGKSLRNERLAAEWVAAKNEYEAKAASGGVQTPQPTPVHTPPQIPPRNVPPTKNQEPRTKSVPDFTLEVGREVVAPSRYEPTRLPADRAENEVTAEIQRLQNELGGWLCKLSEHPRSELMVPAWTRKVTAYERKDKTRVNGVADYRTIRSIERLEKSIEDAKWWLEKLDRPEAQGA